MFTHFYTRTKGFSLLEVIITIAIVGILVSVAIPAYKASQRKSNRADAKITLSKLALQQERYYFRTNQYATGFSDLLTGVDGMSTVESDDGHYTIRLNGSVNAWSMTAISQGDQSRDRECTSLTLTNLGNKTALNASNNQSPACW